MIVVDTNVMVHLLTGGERRASERPDCSAPIRSGAHLLLLLSELRNVIVGFLRRHWVGPTDGRELYADAEAVLDGRVGRVDGVEVTETALDLGLSAYDAEFVVLARSLGVPLVSRDRAILEAATDCARPL